MGRARCARGVWGLAGGKVLGGLTGGGGGGGSVGGVTGDCCLPPCVTAARPLACACCCTPAVLSERAASVCWRRFMTLTLLPDPCPALAPCLPAVLSERAASVCWRRNLRMEAAAVARGGCSAALPPPPCRTSGLRRPTPPRDTARQAATWQDTAPWQVCV